MEFEYTLEQKQMRDLATQIAASFDRTYWQRLDEEERYPYELDEILVKQGICGMTIDPAYGGSGLGLLDAAIVTEALAEGDAHSPSFTGGVCFGGYLLCRHGTPEQKARWLPEIVQGTLWCGAFTESDAGSNIANIKTTAKLDGDVYRISGEKAFITAVALARHMTITCRTSPYDPRRRLHGISVLVADLPNPRIEARPLKKLGMREMDTSMVFFNDLEVPRENLVGEQDRGLIAFRDVANAERIIIAATGVGTGNYLIRRAVEYACQRQVWDVPIGAHQGIQFPLVKARIDLQTAKLKVYEAAWLFDQGRSCGVEAAMAKYVANHAAFDAADCAMQTFGGSGYITDTGIERYWRDLRADRLGPISEEMILNFLAQHDLNLPRSY